jgi:hypothetical protein
MTRVLRDAFGDLVGDEPPMRLEVAHIVVAGRRRRTRRRWMVSAAVAAVLVPVLGMGVAVAVRQPVERGVGVIADRPTTTSPSVGPPGPSAGTGRPPSTNGPTVSSPPAVPSASGTSGPASGDGAEGLVDPGFEADPVSWDVFGPATTLAGARTVHGGQRAARIATTAPERSVAGATSRPVRVSTEAGARYTASCWVRATGTLDAYVQVQEYTTAWVRDGEPVKSARFTLTDPAVWYRISVAYTAARAGNLLPLTVFGSDMTAAGPVLLADDCSLRRS